MKIIRALTITALLLPLAACGASEEEEAEAQAEAQALAESLGNAMEEAAEEAEAEAEEAPAEEAPAAEGEGNTCEQAYAGILQMVAAMKKSLGGGDEPLEEDAEKRAEFMQKCGELPPEVQQCLVMSYAMEHQEECEQYRDQLQSVRGS